MESRCHFCRLIQQGDLSCVGGVLAVSAIRMLTLTCCSVSVGGSMCRVIMSYVRSSMSSYLVSNVHSAKFSGKGSDPKVGRRTPHSALMHHAVHSYTTRCTRAPRSALMHHAVHSCTTCTVHSYTTQCSHTPHSALIHRTVHSYTTQCTYTPQYL